MKKFTFISFALVAMLCSCNKEIVSPVTGPVNGTETKNAIVFGVDSELLESKAVTESTASQVQTNGFNVAGVTSENVTLFGSSKATWDSAKSWYSTATTYYYPATGTMSFYAVYPVSQAVTVTSGAATLAYSANENTDLIAAKATGVSASNNSVALTFDHILSQVDFTAKGADSKVTYKITSIKVTAPTSGTYAYSNGSWTKGATDAQTVYLSTSTDVSTSEATSVGVAQTFIPVELTVSASWECYSGGVKAAEYNNVTAKFTPTKGKKCTVNLTLPNSDGKGITFTISVNPWGTESKDVVLNPTTE